MTQKELKDCEKQKNLCVMSSADCRYMALDGAPQVPRSPGTRLF